MKRIEIDSEEVTWGADPEFILVNQKQQVIPADTVLPFKKKGEHKTLYFDGLNAEIECPAMNCRENFGREAMRVIQSLNAVISRGGISISQNTTQEIDLRILEEAHPSAKEFGCSPDITIYTWKQQQCQFDASKHNLRYAGGHIHIGFPQTVLKKRRTNKAFIERFIKFCDLFIGVPLVIITEGNKQEALRRQAYGYAGAFRIQPWGYEYRVPSNQIFKHEKYISMITGLMQKVLDYTKNLKYEDVVKTKKETEIIRQCVNKNNLALAWKLLTEFDEWFFPDEKYFVNKFKGSDAEFLPEIDKIRFTKYETELRNDVELANRYAGFIKSLKPVTTKFLKEANTYTENFPLKGAETSGIISYLKQLTPQTQQILEKLSKNTKELSKKILKVTEE